MARRSRAELLQQLDTVVRQVGAQSVLISDTVAAMTAVLDRLERAGFARRRRDRTDRRRVLVEAMPRAVQCIEPFYRPIAAAMAALHERHSDRQLAAVVDYLSQALAIGAEHVQWLQTQPAIRRKRGRTAGRDPRRHARKE